MPRGLRLGFASACLVALLVLSFLAVWIGVPAWHVRFAGVQTVGTATLDYSCGTSTDADGNPTAETYQVSIKFTDQNGKLHEVGSHWACNNLYDDGEQVSLWYLPDDPASFLTGGEAAWLAVFTGLWVLVVGVLVTIFLRLARFNR